jgi:hypothetical protein
VTLVAGKKGLTSGMSKKLFISPRRARPMLKVFAALRENGVSKSDIARALGVYAMNLDAIIFGLAMTTTDRSGNIPPEISSIAGIG